MQIIIKEMHQLIRRQAANHNRRSQFQSRACQDRRHFQSSAYRPITTVECRSSSGRTFKYRPIDTRLRARTFGRRRFATSSKTAMNVNTNKDISSEIFFLTNMIFSSLFCALLLLVLPLWYIQGHGREHMWLFAHPESIDTDSIEIERRAAN